MWAALREWAGPVSKALAAPAGLSQTREVGESYTKVSHALIRFSGAKVGTLSPFKNLGL